MMNEATLDFIRKHEKTDVHELSLMAKNYPDVDMPLALRQITGRQKVREKIPQYYACEQLLYPVRLSLEQSSSELTALYKSQLCEGKLMADLTGGFGVDSYFLSANFESFSYVERDEELCHLAGHNFNVLGRKNINVVHSTAEAFLETTEKMDWIYLDPARRKKSGGKAVLLSDSEPDLSLILESLYAKSDHILVKLSPMLDVMSLIRDLRGLREIHILAVENECKELVVLLKKGYTGKQKIVSRGFLKNKKTQSFDFDLNREINVKAFYSNEVLDYLYEPNAAILKAGAFKLISGHYGVHKLHPNSHLYTSEELVIDFPGRIFRIKGVYDFSKKSIKELKSQISQTNLTIRNFPASVADLRKRLKLEEGGDSYLFATTLSEGSKVLILCEKV